MYGGRGDGHSCVRAMLFVLDNEREGCEGHNMTVLLM